MSAFVLETKDKSVPRENSMSDSEENSAIKDSDQQSVGDTDNQVKFQMVFTSQFSSFHFSCLICAHIQFPFLKVL